MSAFEPRWTWAVYGGKPRTKPYRSHEESAAARAAALAWLRYAPHLKIADAERGCGGRAGMLYDRIRRDPQLRLELDRLRAAGGKPMHWRRRNNLDRQARERQTAVNA